MLLVEDAINKKRAAAGSSFIDIMMSIIDV
ncbi:hypothetical protein QFZ72_005132 [Bacillus sp. V2I10]|nr:hypothetical protein [Bacillus sp. V2I10]